MNKLIASMLLCCVPLWVSAQPVLKAKAATSSHVDAKNKAKPAVTELPLTDDELAIAGQIHTGMVPCELGIHVTVSADAKLPGYFHLHTKHHQYHMQPVMTSTGAIRLEDKKAGAVWLQLANKSMLMNQKLGQRLADECMSPAQHTVAEAMKKSPAPSVLDAPTVAVAPATK